jgi:hypothetical protein
MAAKDLPEEKTGVELFANGYFLALHNTLTH